MTKKLLHKFRIKPIRIELENLDSIGGFVSTPKCFLVFLRRPKFLRRKLSNKIAKAETVKAQTQELKNALTAIKILGKAMTFYIKYHPNVQDKEVNSAISFLNEQNIKIDKVVSKIEQQTDEIKKRVNQ